MGVNLGFNVENKTLGMFGLCSTRLKGDINALVVLGYDIWRVPMRGLEFERHVGIFQGKMVDGAFSKAEDPATMLLYEGLGTSERRDVPATLYTKCSSTSR